MKINSIKANGKDYDIWATSAEVEELNNAGNAALGKELSSGKQLIAQAINEKGGTASADESLAELAEDITNTIIAEDFLTKWFKGESPYDGGTFTSDVEYFAAYKMYGVPFTEINLPYLTDFNTNNFRYCNNLRVLRLPSYAPTTIGGAENFLGNNPQLEELYLDTFNLNVGGIGRYCSAPIKKIYAPEWNININTLGAYSYFGQFSSSPRVLEELIIKGFSNSLNKSTFYGYNSIRRIVLTQAPTSDVNFRYLWTCSNVIAEGQSGIDELNTNVQALADNFLDYTGMTGHIITFNTDLYNVLTEETKQKFTDKNWAVAYA